MVVIGIVGGVASGKSAVAQMFESLGAVRLDADHAGHLVLLEPDVREQLIARWGDLILDAAGQIDRSQVATIVFDTRPQGADELRFLELVTHPRIGALLQRQLDAAAAAGATACVLDAALMLEAGWDQFCDHLVFVEVPHTERVRRARQRGWSTAEWEARESAQWPLDQKRQRCDTIIDNSGSLEETFVQVTAAWSTWKVDRD